MWGSRTVDTPGGFEILIRVSCKSTHINSPSAVG
jgi:hypothetical protein